MILITGGPQSGKTQKLLEMCVEGGGRIVCRDPDRVREIERRADDMGVHLDKPLTFAQYAGREYRGLAISRLYIDDADRFIICMGTVGAPMIAATWTDSPMTPVQPIMKLQYPAEATP